MNRPADTPRPIELLAPAKNVQTAMSAIIHGADAVYIGPEGFGARSTASNSTDDIQRLCDFAHPFRARVYATVNTIVFDHELKAVERMIHNLYRAGVDALIVQDMGILRLELPPIALHASTQCDTRTVEKALFLQEAGFSQIVLARELSLEQIAQICEHVTVPIETFIHGALCVSYSGRCHASYALCGRSANRGRCAQICRLPYTLRDAGGHILSDPKYLLSLKDFNTSDLLADLLQSGVSSFKIEGRLKDEAYVKNVTAWYRSIIDKEIASHPSWYCRSSVGSTDFNFEANPIKSFNRGFTHYFLKGNQPSGIASIHTPKSLGEPLSTLSDLHAGDGISYFNSKGEYTGVRVNKMVTGHPVFAKPIHLPKGVQIFRTTDHRHNLLMSRHDTARRKIAIEIELNDDCVCVSDERGYKVTLPVPEHSYNARQPMEPRRFFDKLGDTIYELRGFKNQLKENSFIPASVMTALRRNLIQALDEYAASYFMRPARTTENRNYPYPYPTLTFADNVSNSKALEFYKDHGVQHIQPALERDDNFREIAPYTVLMTTKHCILRELGLCKKRTKSEGGPKLKEPLTIDSGNGARFQLRFNCKLCEMQVLKTSAKER